MIERFAAYAPVVRKLFALAPSEELVEWKLRIHSPLKSWIDTNTVLLGDSAHATLPVSVCRMCDCLPDPSSNIRSISRKVPPWRVKTEVDQRLTS